MKCPLCHSEDTHLQDNYLCCPRCNSRFLLDAPIGPLDNLVAPQHDKLDKIHTDFELHRLVRDVERGVNRP